MGAAGGIVGAATGFAINHGMTEGSLFSLAGAIIGAGAAVYGAFLTVQMAAQDDARKARAYLKASADSIRISASSLLQPFEPNLEEYKPFRLRFEAVTEAVNSILFEAPHLSDDELLRRAGWMFEMQKLRRAILEGKTALIRLRDDPDLQNGHQEAFPSRLQSVSDTAMNIQLLAQHAIAALDRQ